MGDLTLNFSRSEFSCKGEHCCGHSAPINMRLVVALQTLRTTLGVPLHVNSGFRCRTHDEEVSGFKKDSQHSLGTAADVQLPSGLTIGYLLTIARSIDAFRGIGIGTTYLHLDVREGDRVEWVY